MGLSFFQPKFIARVVTREYSKVNKIHLRSLYSFPVVGSISTWVICFHLLYMNQSSYIHVLLEYQELQHSVHVAVLKKCNLYRSQMEEKYKMVCIKILWTSKKVTPIGFSTLGHNNNLLNWERYNKSNRRLTLAVPYYHPKKKTTNQTYYTAQPGRIIWRSQS